MNTERKKIFPLRHKLNSNLHPNKRSNQASFIPHLPGFVLKVIASHSLKSNSNFNSLKEFNALKKNASNSIFNISLNWHNYESGIIDYAKHFKNNLLN